MEIACKGCRVVAMVVCRYRLPTNWRDGCAPMIGQKNSFVVVVYSQVNWCARLRVMGVCVTATSASTRLPTYVVLYCLYIGWPKCTRIPNIRL